MLQFDCALIRLTRPRLLARAAQFGAKRYKRQKHLKSLTPNGNRMGKADLLKDLLEKENDLEWHRQQGAADYNVRRHVLLLSAIIVEAKTPAVALVQ